MMSEEKRLIDANALANRIWNEAERYKGTDGFVWVRRGKLGLLLYEAPTIDAVQVVRCRECKHMIRQSHTRYCTVWNAVNGMGDDGFCNYGERKEGAD